MRLYKIKRILLLIFMVVIVFLCMAQEKSLVEIENELIERGYKPSRHHWINTLMEFYYFKKKHPNKETEKYQMAEIRIGMVIYHFVFFRHDEPNVTVEAEIINEEGNMVKQYYKVNENGSPPNVWVNLSKENGIIDLGERRRAWY
jgi:hypothetical protein